MYCFKMPRAALRTRSRHHVVVVMRAAEIAPPLTNLMTNSRCKYTETYYGITI